MPRPTKTFWCPTSSDFHPTDVLEDADGSLLVIDTGGWFRIGCPTSQIAKPEIGGGIYRIRRADAPPVADPRGLEIDWDCVPPTPTLVDLLGDPRPAVAERAIDRLALRGDRATGRAGRRRCSRAPTIGPGRMPCGRWPASAAKMRGCCCGRRWATMTRRCGWRPRMRSRDLRDDADASQRWSQLLARRRAAAACARRPRPWDARTRRPPCRRFSKRRWHAGRSVRRTCLDLCADRNQRPGGDAARTYS